METIKIENLTFTYPGFPTPAIANINLEIKSGDFITICGKSGCGKSTLLKMLKPSLTPTGILTGDVIFGDKKISLINQRELTKKIGFIMQNPDNQIVCDKVWHELAFGLENLGFSTQEIRGRVAEMASFFGIQNWYYKDVNTLSGGQKQLLNLASVMVLQPSILILDEPTSQLDPIAAQEFLNTVHKINKEIGTTVILSEHRLEEALPLSDKVIVLDKGRIIAEGTVKEVGKKLKETENEMLLAFPTPMRIYYSKNHDSNCPVTIGDGRKWLRTLDTRSNTIDNDDTPPLSEEIALTANNVWYRYEKSSPDILKGININIRKGEFYAITGGNGVGKTTVLMALTDICRPHRGTVDVHNNKIALLTQNPQNLFVKNTVLADLQDVLEKDKMSDAEKNEKIESIINLCRLNEIIQRHPYDLSGGEQQRAALAKVLLCQPEILLLDEPTKGIDAHFKKIMADIFRQLKEKGTTIVMVSHDIEFCAKYADRLGLMFDGEIISEGKPREFFTGKSFYTTAASKMAKGILPDAVSDEDIINAIGGISQENRTTPVVSPTPVYQSEYVPSYESPIKTSKRTLLAAIAILLLIPFTIFAGIKFLGDRKYYFISILIILETILPFAIAFESRRPQAKEVVVISILCAITVAGRIAFAPFPMIKPVFAIIIISGIALSCETGFMVGALTAFISNFYFTQGPWTPWQMFVYGLIGFLAGILAKSGILCKNKYAVSIFGFLATVIIHGGIMNPASVIMYQGYINWEMIKSSIKLGFPLDVYHGIATAVFLFITFNPMMKKLERVKTKYGI